MEVSGGFAGITGVGQTRSWLMMDEQSMEQHVQCRLGWSDKKDADMEPGRKSIQSYPAMSYDFKWISISTRQ